MMDNRGENEYRTHPTLVKAMEKLMILHAEHEIVLLQLSDIFRVLELMFLVQFLEQFLLFMDINMEELMNKLLNNFYKLEKLNKFLN